MKFKILYTLLIKLYLKDLKIVSMIPQLITSLIAMNLELLKLWKKLDFIKNYLLNLKIDWSWKFWNLIIKSFISFFMTSVKIITQIPPSSEEYYQTLTVWCKIYKNNMNNRFPPPQQEVI